MKREEMDFCCEKFLPLLPGRAQRKLRTKINRKVVKMLFGKFAFSKGSLGRPGCEKKDIY